jgi:cellulose synthase/poly-beta-1,6-N-acetylglucosamine synthase-like glycosyltransferase
VDNTPRDERSLEVALGRGVQYLIEPVRGLSRARNRGARACEAEIVAYLDDDAVADPGWLTALARDFEDPLVAVVTGAILPNHPPREAALNGEDSVACGTGRRQKRIVERTTPGWFEIANFGEMGDGSNMAFRHSAFDVWPGFDEDLGRGTILNGGEEHYAFFTLIEHGYRIVYEPEAIVRHPCVRTIQELRCRHLSLLAIAAAYITRLAIEHPSCRSALGQYILDRLRGTTRPWTCRSEKTVARVAPRWLSLLAMFSGPWIYLSSRMARKISGGRGRAAAKKFENTPVSAVALRDETFHLES